MNRSAKSAKIQADLEKNLFLIYKTVEKRGPEKACPTAYGGTWKEISSEDLSLRRILLDWDTMANFTKSLNLQKKIIQLNFVTRVGMF